MEERKKITMWQRIGYFFLALLPLVVFFIIQVAAVAGFGLIMLVQTALPYIRIGALQELNFTDLFILIENIFFEHMMSISAIHQLISMAVFGIWYYFMVPYRKKVKTDKAIGVQAAIGIPLLGVGAEIVISLLLGIVTIVFPTIMQEYTELMQEAGLDEVSFAVIVVTVILAPILEEITFRGVMLYYAQKMTRHFWIANVFQALLFGIAHMNLVQGIYAFALGVIMGGVYCKYRSVKATILLHAAFNFMGTVVIEALSSLPENSMMLLSIEGMMILCGIIGLILVLADNKKKAL